MATWVVDSAKPRWLEARMTAAEALSAAMPCGGRDLDQALAERTDDPPAAEVGAGGDGDRAGELHPERDAVVSVHSPAAIRARVMTPIVFWASLVPCASETSEALPIWPQRKPWSVNCSATPDDDPEDQPGADRGDHAGDDRRRRPRAGSPCR